MQTLEPYPELACAMARDLPDILALLRRCELLESGVAEAIDDFVVLRNGNELLGCAGLEVYGQHGLLRSVAIQPSARKLGLGRQLVDAVVAAARSRGLCELYLLTTTAPEFFERLGFAPLPRASVPSAIAESWEFRVGCPQSARTMRRALGEVH